MILGVPEEAIYVKSIYRSLPFCIYKLGNELYITRNFIQEALGYVDHRGLARMRSRYPSEFDNEYIESVNIGDKTFYGMYTIKGVVCIADHTRGHRRADELLVFLKALLRREGSIKADLIPDIKITEVDTVKSLLSRVELLFQKVLEKNEDILEQLSEIDEIKEEIKRISQDVEDEETEEIIIKEE